MSKQQRRSSSAKQETQLKNRNIGLIAGLFFLALIIFGTLSLQDDSFPEEDTTFKKPRIEDTRLKEPTRRDVQEDRLSTTQDTQSAPSSFDEPKQEESFSEQAPKEESTEVQQGLSQKKRKKNQLTDTQTTSTAGVQSTVQWAGMDAAIEGTDAVIRWNTAFEANTAYFEIERSIDEVTFEKIGKVQGKAMPNLSDQEYWFADSALRHIGMPRFYYRVNQVGLDNKVHKSDIFEYDLGLNLDLYIRVEEIDNGYLTVAYSGDEAGKANVGVVTPSGKTIYDEEVEVDRLPKRRKLDASLWGEGVYILVLYNHKTRVREMLEISN